MDATEAKIRQQIKDTTILVYMKGSPRMPQCGFSARVVECLNACGVEFGFVNVLENPDIRAKLPEIANWPTFPQLWVNGELIGGCDIVTELHAQGELAPLLKGKKH